MNKSDYASKIRRNQKWSLYLSRRLNTLRDLNRFRKRNFANILKTMEAHQPARIYVSAKTHKFNSIDDITLDKLKFRPIIAQTGTYTYKSTQVIGDYLKPLISSNNYIIKNPQDFASILKNQRQLNSNKQYNSYGVESLFIYIPIKETIEYILKKIYDEKKLSKLCSRLILRRLLLKLTNENTFTFQGKYYKQIDGCTMVGPLSFIFSNIFMIKLEEDAVKPLNPPFYKRFVDDVITKMNKECSRSTL